jgi:crotonobetainyl-CoA:carnitine CoA-transferase CaiB-like acyl-CoA transferase
MEQTPPPLSGLRVVTTANALPAAVVGLMLADHGAEVFLLEPPSGSRLRPHAAWSYWARGQRSVSLDLRDPKEQERARGLIDGSDVFVDGWSTGLAARLGLAPELLSERNPRLVQARISAFGDESPLAGAKGWEPIVMGVIGGSAGFSNLVARDGPAYVSTPFCSVGAAHLALHGILGALLERERSGVGQRVSTTLAQGFLAFDTWNWLLHVLALRYSSAFEMEAPYDREALVPNTPFFFRLFVGLTKDGTWLQFSQTTDRLWEAFLAACSLDPSDPAVREAPVSEDPRVRIAFWETLLAAVAGRTAAEWREAFDEDPNVWAEPFRDESNALEHPQLVADRRIIRDAAGVAMPGALAQAAAWPELAARPAPELGADNDALEAPEVRAASPADPTDAPPLAGVTVLELGMFYAAPFGATLLAEQGARVIKVEPAEGDPIRTVIPFPDLAAVKVLQGKESVVVDLATPEGRSVLAELVRRSDVVLQGYRAGVAERLGCTAEELLRINPDLVYVNAPGYGDGGPCGHRPAFAPTIGAASGLAVRNVGGPGNVPRGTTLDPTTVKGTAIKLASGAMAQGNADGFAGLGVATVMLLGLLGRTRFGGANVLRSSMLSTMAHALADTATDGPGRPTPPPDGDLYGLGPLHRLYRSAEGWVMLVADGPSERAALAECTGLDPGDDGLERELEAAFLTGTAVQWQERLLARGVTCVAVSRHGTERTVMLGDLGAELGLVTTETHPTLDEYPRLEALTRFSRSRSTLGPAPLLGQQTESVLAELEITAVTG